MSEKAREAELKNDSPAVAPHERRQTRRHKIDARAAVLLVHSWAEKPARIVDLSLGGCRIRTELKLEIALSLRVELEFYLRGLSFRVGGVTQQMVDSQTIGIRFRDLSPRNQGQLAELMAEIAEAEEQMKLERRKMAKTLSAK